jgi:hypothetical protein
VAKSYLLVGSIAIVAVFLFEGGEAALLCNERTAPMMQVIEETFELIVLWCFLQVNSRMAANHQL